MLAPSPPRHADLRIMAQGPIAFLLSAPRSGSTLLLRMLNAHPQVRGLAEPHLVTPLQALRPRAPLPAGGLRARRGMESFLESLPEGRAAQTQALRAYLDTLYGAALGSSPEGTQWLVDKTPAYAPAVRFIRSLYPHAPLIILRRHPAAIVWSQAQAFFGGDLQRARIERPILTETIPALASALRGELGPCVVVDYEHLVQAPVEEMHRVFDALGLPACPEAVDYGRVPMPGPGDPIEVDKHTRPVPDLSHRWEHDLVGRPALRTEIEAQLAEISDADLQAWGWPRDQIWAPLEGSKASTGRPRTAYSRGRTALLWLRKDIHTRPHGRLLQKVRDLCDLLLGSR